jgi:insertion element IS1 protein InsB
MALRLERYDIEYLCSDGYEVYKQYMISKKHINSKAETCLVESKNSSLRDNLARLNRRTKRYSKSMEMLELSVYLLLFLKIFGTLFNYSLTIPEETRKNKNFDNKKNVLYTDINSFYI